MAYYKFTKNILSEKHIDIYNNGDMLRDFTYISDLVKSISLLLFERPLKVGNRKTFFKNDSISDVAPYRIVNMGNSQYVSLLQFIEELEKILGKVAKKNFLCMQDGDVYKTYSNTDLLELLTGFRPKTTLHEGLSKFINWYKCYH